MSDIEKKFAEIRADLDRVIKQNLADPDLAARSQDFQDGYVRGFREAMLAYIASRITFSVTH